MVTSKSHENVQSFDAQYKNLYYLMGKSYYNFENCKMLTLTY